MSLPEQIVEVHLSRAALRDGFRDAGEEGALVIPGQYDLSLGAAVDLRVGLEDEPCGVFLQAVVQSRRPASAGNRGGLGVRFLRSSADAARFVAQWALGQRETAGRAQWRYPVDLPVVLVTSPRGSTRIYPCILVDASTNGARASISHRIEPGSEVRCEWKGEFGSGAVATRAVWNTHGGLGLALNPGRPEERVAWEQLIGRVRGALRERVVQPLPDGSRISASSTPAVGRERGFTPTPIAGSPAAVANQVIPKLVEIPASDALVSRKRHDPRSE
jgi:hypothetical protein